MTFTFTRVSFSTKASISSFMAITHSSACAELIASQYDVGVRPEGRM